MPVIPDVGSLPGLGSSLGFDPVLALLAILGSLFLSLIAAWVYKATHRGLSYSQSFQFSLVLLGMLGSVVMMIASGSLLRAIGILGAFSLIRFRTAIKDPKDMAYILLVLSIGLAMGAGLYLLAVITAVVVCATILILTWLNFGLTSYHEAVVRLMCVPAKKGQSVNVAAFEAQLEKLTDTFRLLNAHAQGDRMELTFGIRPRSGSTALSILEVLRKEDGIEHATLFDAKHQVEF